MVYPTKYYETDGTDPVKHIYAGGLLIATVDDTGVSATVYHVHSDQLTGSNVLSDSDGYDAQLLDYMPYGSVRINSGSYNELRQFTGSEYDVDTGLNYANARYYNSAIGRFISQDPQFLTVGFDLTDPQSMNSYSYARNNPLRYIDPDGQAFMDYVNNVGGYGVGLAQGGWQFAKGTAGLAYNTVAHPVQTFNNGVATLDATAGFISYAIQDPSGAGNAISQGFTNGYNNFETKSAYEQGKAVGNVVGQIEASIMAGAAASKAAQALKGESAFSQAASHSVERNHYPGLSKSQVENIAKSTKANADIKVNIKGTNGKQYYYDSGSNNLFINNPTQPTVFSPTLGLDYLRDAVSRDIRRGGKVK